MDNKAIEKRIGEENKKLQELNQQVQKTQVLLGKLNNELLVQAGVVSGLRTLLPVKEIQDNGTDKS